MGPPPKSPPRGTKPPTPPPRARPPPPHPPPARDPALPSPFDAATLERRAGNKAALQRRLGLPPRPEVPLLGVVNRLADQKGIDILLPALERLLPQRDVQFALLGTGERTYEERFRELAARFPQRAACVIAFDDALARLIYGGCDVFLMPSRFEPCGLGQMIAMRYGSIPLARRTGGLADTIQDCTPDLGSGTGFLFDAYTPEALLEAVHRAVAAWGRQDAWQALQRRAMAQDFSWDASARRYVAVYNELRRRKQVSTPA